MNKKTVFPSEYRFGWPSARTPKRVLTIVCAVLVAGWLVALTGAVDRSVAPVEVELQQLKPTTFSVKVQQRGMIEPMSSTIVHSDCYWSTQILTIVPEGTMVKKGEVVCVLDASDIEDYARKRELILLKYRRRLEAARHDQKMLTSQNERRLSAAEFNYQRADQQLDEYSDGTYPQQLEEMEQNLAMLAQKASSVADEARHTERLWTMGMVNRQEMDRQSFKLTNAWQKHQTLESKLNLMTEFTHPRSELQLTHRRNDAHRDLARVSISNGLAETRSRLTILSYERTLRIYDRYYQRALNSIDACTLTAPCDGQVVYGNSWYLMSRGITYIEEGAKVRNRQKVFEIPDPKRLKVSVPLSESLIYSVHKGMPVTVRLPGYEDVEVAAEIAMIPKYPRPRSSYTPGIKDYWLDVELLPTVEQRELLSVKSDAIVEIVTTEIPDAIQIPRDSVTGIAGENFVYVFDGQELVPRQVALGDANEDSVCVLEGLSLGENVVTDMTSQHKEALQSTLVKALQN